MNLELIPLKKLKVEQHLNLKNKKKLTYQSVSMIMETESIQVLLHRNGFDKTIHDFENFTRKVFNGSDEIQKKNLHKKLEEFT